MLLNKFDINDKGNADVKNPPAPSPSIPDGNAGAGNGGGGQATEDPTIHLEPGAKFNKHQEGLTLI